MSQQISIDRYIHQSCIRHYILHHFVQAGFDWFTSNSNLRRDVKTYFSFLFWILHYSFQVYISFSFYLFYYFLFCSFPFPAYFPFIIPFAAYIWECFYWSRDCSYPTHRHFTTLCFCSLSQPTRAAPFLLIREGLNA